MKKVLNFTILSVCILWALNSFSQNLNTSLVGHWGYGPCAGFDVNGSYAFIGSGCMFLVLDITNPDEPIEVANILLPALIRDVTIDNNFAYVADSDSGLFIIDIQDPILPVKVGVCSSVGNVFDVVVNNNYAYVIDLDLADGFILRIIDVSDPEFPIEISYDPEYHTSLIAVSGDYAYLPHEEGLLILNISNPYNPTEIGTCLLPQVNYIHDFFVLGSHIYLAASSGFHIIDISNPNFLFEAGYFDTDGEAWTVTATPNYTYVICGSEGNDRLNIFSIDDPTNPELLGIFNETNLGQNLVVNDEYVYCTSGFYDFTIVDVSNPDEPTKEGIYLIPGRTDGITLNGDYAYIVDYEYWGTPYSNSDHDLNLRVVNVSNLSEPYDVGFFRTPGSLMEVAVQNNLAYMADFDSGFIIADISNPEMIYEVGRLQIPGYTLGVTVKDNYAYLACDDGFRIIDIANPTIPFEIGNCDSLTSLKSVVVKDNYAYVTARVSIKPIISGLQIIDISNPFSPFVVGSCNVLGSAYDMEIVGNYVYIADYDWGLVIIDISNPFAPYELGNYQILNGAQYLSVENRFCYITGYFHNKMYILDVSNPETPIEVGSFETPDWATGVAAMGEYVAVGGWRTGMFIIENELVSDVEENSELCNVQSIDIYPNPFTEELNIELKNDHTRVIVLETFSISGEKLSHQEIQGQANTQQSISWNPKSEGINLTQGIYLVKLTQGKSSIVRKVVYSK